MDKLLVTLFGLGLIAFIYWFFFGKKDEAVEVSGGEIEIIVKGGYKPEIIKVKKGQKTTLTFIREDPSSCLEEVVLSDFKIKKFLPLMHCGMNMYHGKIIVEG